MRSGICLLRGEWSRRSLTSHSWLAPRVLLSHETEVRVMPNYSSGLAAPMALPTLSRWEQRSPPFFLSSNHIFLIYLSTYMLYKIHAHKST